MRLKFFVAAAMLSASLAARADTLDYTLSGAGNTVTFALNQNPQVSYTFPEGFQTTTITIDANGTNVQGFAQFALPGNSAGGCDFALSEGSDACDFPGSNIYFTGSPSDPTLLAGTFSFIDANSGNAYTLTAVDVPTSSVTPEPSSFLLLGTGLLGTLGAMRKRFVWNS